MHTSAVFFARRASLVVLIGALTTLGCTITTTTTNSRSPDSTGEPAKQPSAPKPKPEPKPAEAPIAKPKKTKKKPKPKPQVAEAPKPAPEPPAPVTPPPAAQPEQSTLVVPVRVGLDALAKELDAHVPKTDKKDWKQISKGDDSPKADLKYELWRDPIEVELVDHTFRITVPVRYAATIRARVKNPLSSGKWIWIAKNETWGTRADPQRITAVFETSLGVDPDWHVESKTRLVTLKHGEAPSGEICKRIVVPVCVEKSVIADEVRDGIDERLEPKLKKALAKVDAQVEKAFELEKRASAVWSALQAPHALPGTKDGAWLVVQPSRVGVGRPSKDGSEVRVDLAIEGRVSVRSGGKPELEPTALPKPSEVEGASGVHVIAELRLPADVLSSALERELKSLRFSGKDAKKLSITRAQLLLRADAEHPRRVALKLALGEAPEDELELRGDLVLDAASQRLSIEGLELTAASERALAGFDRAAIRKQLAAKAHWDLGDEAAPLRKAITAALEGSLRGHASVRAALSQLDVKDFTLDADALSAKVIIGGTLEVEITPR